MKLEIDVSEEAYEAYQTLADAMGKENFDKGLGDGIVNALKAALKPKETVETESDLMQMHRHFINSMVSVPMPSFVSQQMCNAYNPYCAGFSNLYSQQCGIVKSSAVRNGGGM